MTTRPPPLIEERFVRIIADEVGCQARQVQATDRLFADGSTVPFVARYRKEATGGLADDSIETIWKRREYFLELATRRDAILASIAEQGKLTPELEAAIRATASKQELEDLYLPFKPKRRTRAQIARERGLEPLADALLAHLGKVGADVQPVTLAKGYVDGEKGVANTDAALAGARDILAERLAESADQRADVRSRMATESHLRVKATAGATKDDSKNDKDRAIYRDYFDYDEALPKIPSHRLLAILRGERAGILHSELEFDDATAVTRLEASWGHTLKTPCGREVAEATRDGYKRLLRPSIANEVKAEARAAAEAEAIRVFRSNLEALLMQAPLGQLAVAGLDPGYRTGCKVAVVDDTGKVVDTSVIYAVPPNARPEEAASTLVDLVRKHKVRAVAVGNGTASRETERFARDALKAAKISGVVVAIVPETGASVYSASAFAREELPELDVSLRGAVSIARRLQDPLAELVKIEPRSMGVGQYQHDVDQRSLAHELDLTVEAVVNRVGVELNTASAPLLQRVSGLTERIAKAIVAYRDAHGRIEARNEILSVSGLGPKTFEQAAGFLRIRNGKNALDATGVHPERYDVVQSMAARLEIQVDDLIGQPECVAQLDFRTFADAEAGVGEYTLNDIRAELERPGRDPRPDFQSPEWRDDVQSVDDLKPGLTLEGRVSNVTNFGAFVDLGVKRDGLVHVSELSHRWVSDPREIVQVGQIVKVKVMEVDKARERIALSMKALEPAPEGTRRRR